MKYAKRNNRQLRVLRYGQVVVARLAKTLIGFGASPESATIQAITTSPYLPHHQTLTPLVAWSRNGNFLRGELEGDGVPLLGTSHESL